MTVAINLSKLPSIDFVAQKTLDQATQDSIDWIAENEGIIITGPEDPRYRLVRSFALRETTLRFDFNEACKQLTLADATDGSLDHIGVTYHRTERLDGELDDPYRERCALAPEGYTIAGSEDAYIYFARSASASVKSVDCDSPAPCYITLSVLSTEGDGTPDQALLDLVDEATSPKIVRPKGDRVTVQAASILPYTVNATLHVYPGPGLDLVSDAAEAATQLYADEEHRLSGIVAESGLDKALHQPGVAKAVITGWTGDIEAAADEAPYCTAINITTVEVV